MKKSTTNFETTITVSKETRNALKKIKNEGKYRTYDEVISTLLSAKEGLVKDYQIVEAPQIAMVLNYIVLDDKGVQSEYFELEISYSQLRRGVIGQSFSIDKQDEKYYVWEKAEIIWKDSNFIVLKITEEVMQDELAIYNHLVGVELF